ncbi:hypothetical protein [Leptospira sarikeiensis]|uniref:Uncharacterized protein n=1 Tax=Leptospira sarikeiensis TaxID=2484943 RepID=A0A4V3JR56_9LEPT|nr:hypothetical protein [Leptospira sarikeiensis]TGL58715.1 hypothetical protein EHQ64_16825 [Leptospira sarikeiensis]
MKTKNIILTICILILANSIEAREFSSSDILFVSQKNNAPMKVNLNAYFLAHNFLTHVAGPLGLDLSANEAVGMLRFIAASGSLAAPNQILIKNFQNGDDLKINFRYLKPKNDIILLFTANYNVNSSKIDNEDEKNIFATIFVLSLDRLVYYNDTYSKEKEDELKKSDNLLSLSDSYILDELFENDNLVIPILNKIESDSKRDPFEKVIAILSKGQIALIKNDFKSSEDIISAAKSAMGNLSGEKLTQLKQIFDLFSYEHSVVRLYTEK